MTALWTPGELGGGAQVGGRFVGPLTQTIPIWNGRPPRQNNLGPLSMYLSATSPPAALGQTIPIHVECGNSLGGRVVRDFEIGAGLSASLRVGNWEHVKVLGLPNVGGVAGGVANGATLFFTWDQGLENGTALYSFLDYPVPNTQIALPEGCDAIYSNVAGNMTFNVDRHANTFVQAVVVGQEVPAIWSSISFSQVTRFIFRMRGI